MGRLHGVWNPSINPTRRWVVKFTLIMRSKTEMLELILATARDDDRIRAVILNGSRVNPNIEPDIFQDFDIAYLVTAVEPFTRDHTWIGRFGERMILQMPETMQDPPPDGDGSFAYLMQFADGNRIDLTLKPVATFRAAKSDSLSVVLLDKDGAVGPLPAANEGDYLPTPPTAKAFDDCCNEFWWLCPYIAKGLRRRQLLYAKQVFDQPLRAQLMKMLVWHAGIKTGFVRNFGSYEKYLPQFLEAELVEMLAQTYADAGFENSWDALFTTGNLFRIAACQVAGHFGFSYPQQDDDRVTAYLRQVRTLPKNAVTIF